MKTNKMEHFVCGVLATYGLVVACGNSTIKEGKLILLEKISRKERIEKKNDDDNSFPWNLCDCNKKNVPVKVVKLEEDK